MPRPMPEYVPTEVVDAIRSPKLKMWTLYDLAKSLKVKKNTMCHFFKLNEHQSLFTFKRFCDACKITMDDGAMILATKDDFLRMRRIDTIIRDEYQTYQECADMAGISEDYLTDLIRGGAGNKILSQYKPLADKLDWTLEYLATILGDTKK